MTKTRELKYFEHLGSKDEKSAFYFIYSVEGEVFDKGIRYEHSEFITYVGMLTLRHPDRDLKVILDEGIVEIIEKEKLELQKMAKDKQRSFSD